MKTHTHTTFTKMRKVKTFLLVETKVEKLQNTVGSFQFGAFPHIWPFHILGTYFDRGMGYVLPHISRTRVFLDMRILQNDGESSHPSICTIWTKSLELFLRKMTNNDKNPILTPFLAQNSRTRFFFWKSGSVTLASMVP